LTHIPKSPLFASESSHPVAEFVRILSASHEIVKNDSFLLTIHPEKRIVQYVRKRKSPKLLLVASYAISRKRDDKEGRVTNGESKAIAGIVAVSAGHARADL
jgi:hypothetical protein